MKFLELDSGFQSPGFQIPEAKLRHIPVSQATFSGFRNPYSLTWGEMWLQDLPDRKLKAGFVSLLAMIG